MMNRLFKTMAVTAVLCTAACLILTGCTMTKQSGSGAASKAADNNTAGNETAGEKDADTDTEIDLEGVEAAPEEDASVDQGREGRPTDSWNADARDDITPIEDESDLGGEEGGSGGEEVSDGEEGSDEFVPIEEDEEDDEDAAEFAEVETGADSPKRAE